MFFAKCRCHPPSKELALFPTCNLSILIAKTFAQTSWPDRGLNSWQFAKTWTTINEVTRRQSDKTVISELELDEVIISNSAEIADAFNNFFAEIGPNLSNDIEDVHVGFEEFVSHTDHLFSFQQVSHSQVLSHLNKLCKNKATGLDCVSARRSDR